MTVAGRTRQTAHIRNNSGLVTPLGRRRDWLQPSGLRPTGPRHPPMKIKADSGTTTAAAEGASAPVAVRLSHSEGPGDMTAQAHRVFARVRARRGGSRKSHPMARKGQVSYLSSFTAFGILPPPLHSPSLRCSPLPLGPYTAFVRPHSQPHIWQELPYGPRQHLQQQDCRRPSPPYC
jgi:hypothetical protein